MHGNIQYLEAPGSLDFIESVDSCGADSTDAVIDIDFSGSLHYRPHRTFVS